MGDVTRDIGSGTFDTEKTAWYDLGDGEKIGGEQRDDTST